MQQEKRDRSFLMFPWWRDWLLSFVLIGLGFMLSSPSAPMHGLMGYVVMALGATILFTAVVYTAWDVAHESRREERLPQEKD